MGLQFQFAFVVIYVYIIYVYLYMCIIRPRHVNTFHSIAPGSGLISSWPVRVLGVGGTVNASQVVHLVLPVDLFK